MRQHEIDNPGAAEELKVRGGLPILAFCGPAAFEVWLADQPLTSKGLWIRLPKKGSGRAGPTRAQMVDAVLRHGWIDGQQDAYDAASWLVRCTPRRPASRWSQINRTRALALIAAGEIRPAGLAQIEAAKSDGRWEAAYAPASTAQPPPDLQAALDANPAAAAAFASLARSCRYAVIYRVSSLKTVVARDRRIADILGRLERADCI